MAKSRKGKRIVIAALCSVGVVLFVFAWFFFFASRRVAFDSFHGELALDWRIDRSDPSHVSLTKKPGALTVTTQEGGFYLSRGDAKNVFLLENPVGESGDFLATTCLESFRPMAPWNQAGLICFNDGDNFVKWVCIWNGHTARPDLQVYAEIAGQPQLSVENRYVAAMPQSDRLWLRVKRVGDRLLFSTSRDGQSYEVQHEMRWPDESIEWIGLFTSNGIEPGVSEVEASFGFFEVRRAPLAESLMAKRGNEP